MAVFTLHSKISIGNFKPFKGVHDISIKKSLGDYADTAILKLPLTARLKQAGSPQTQSVLTAHQFNVGDKVVIELGYNNKLEREFVGFIRRINMTTPLEIECEGYAYQLRAKKINKSWKETSLTEVLEYLIEGTDIVIAYTNEVKVEDLVFQDETAFSALGKIKDNMHINVWFDENKLYAGLKYSYYTARQKEAKPDVLYKIGHNTINANDIKRTLDKEEKKVTAIYKDKDGTEIRESYGTGLIEEEIKVDNIRNSGDLFHLAKNEVEKEKAKDWEGKIETFLVPFCKPGYKMRIEDARYPERTGNYIVESVDTRFGLGGGRRTVEISYEILTIDYIN